MPEPADTAAEGGDGDRRHLPVLAEPREARPADAHDAADGLAPSVPAGLPAPVVVATGGFLAGIATFVLLRAVRGRGGRSLRRRRRRRLRALDVAGTRSFLVDVHLLRR